MGRRGRDLLNEETLFFVTSTIVDFTPVFKDEASCDILIENIKHYQQKHGFKIYAFVIMPTHFHWIVDVDPQKASLSDVMRDLKKYSAWDILDLLASQGNDNLLKRFVVDRRRVSGQKRKLWKTRFDDLVIRNPAMLSRTIEYIHENPVRANLVETPDDYKYSSARNYTYGDHSVLVVHTEWDL